MPWGVAAAVVGGVMQQQGQKKSAAAGKKAAGAQAKEAEKGAEAMRVEGAATYADQKANIQPWYDAGKEAIGKLSAGIESGAYDPGKFHFDYAAFEKDPGYKFRVDQGERSMERGAAARGKMLSGQQQKALLGYGQEMGSQEYGNSFNRAAQEHNMNAERLKNNYTMMANLSNGGLNAANSLNNARQNLFNARTGATQTSMDAQMGYQGMIGQGNMALANQQAESGGNLMGAGTSYFMKGLNNRNTNSGGSATASSTVQPAVNTFNADGSQINY